MFFIYTYTYIYIYIYYICIHIYMCVCMCIYIYIYIYEINVYVDRGVGSDVERQVRHRDVPPDHNNLPSFGSGYEIDLFGVWGWSFGVWGWLLFGVGCWLLCGTGLITWGIGLIVFGSNLGDCVSWAAESYSPDEIDLPGEGCSRCRFQGHASRGLSFGSRVED